MNYCTNCGSKIKKGDKFCTKCGNNITKTSKEVVKEKKEINIQRIILILGICLVLFSSFALGFITWKSMSSIIKIAFFTFETILFFIISLVLKKLDSKLNKLFFIIGLILVPYTLTLIPYYNLLPEFFNNGPGLYVYLAIIYLGTFISYMLINSKINSKLLNYLAMFSLFLAFVCTGLIFSENLSVITLLIVIYISVLNVIAHTKLFNFDMKKTQSITSAILMVLVVPFILISIFDKTIPYNNILIIFIISIYVISIYIRLFFNNKSIFRGFAPILLPIVLYTYIGNLLYSHSSICFYSITVVAIFLYFITILFNSKLLSYMTLIISYVTILFLMLVSGLSENYTVLFVISTITLIFNISNIALFKYEAIEYVIPFNIYAIIYSLIKWFTPYKTIYVLVITSLVFLIAYIILKVMKKKLSFTYMLASFILSIISMYNLLEGFSIINICFVLNLALLFILTKAYKEDAGFSVATFVFLNIASITIFNRMNHSIYYGMLFISGITLISSLLLSYFKNINLKSYILYSEIVLFVITLFNSFSVPSYILFINILLYAISYLSIIKYYNVKWYRIIYIMLGLLTLTRIIFAVIGPVEIASIISFIVLLIILVIMYLLEIENNITLAIISLIILYPYYIFVSNVLPEINELNILPLVVYDIVFTEIIKFKSKESKKLWTIIPLSILSYIFIIMSSGVGSIVFDIILSLVFILLGLYRKYNYLIYFGIVFIIITIFIRLFTVLNSMIIVVLLIIIGFILIGVALYNELKKKKE